MDAHGGGKSILKVVLEVAFIGVGVFLGLMGEQWRENRRHHELAEQGLQRFRTEIVANRKAIAAVKDYHVDRLKDVQLYFETPKARRKDLDLHLQGGARPAFLDHSAWDFALATQSLTYLDNELAYAISSVYSNQAILQGVEGALLQSIYNNAPIENVDLYLATLQAFFGDSSGIEPRLMTLYDDALQRIDKVLRK